MNQATLFVPKRSTFILRCLFYPRALKCKWLGLPVAPSKPSKTPTKQILRNNIFSAQAASKQLAHSSFQVFRNCRSDPTSSSLIVLQKANDRYRKNRDEVLMASFKSQNRRRHFWTHRFGKPATSLQQNHTFDISAPQANLTLANQSNALNKPI